MIKVAVVEDDPAAAATVRGYLSAYTKDKGVEFETEHFSEAYSFLTNYTARFDIVLMDIELPGLNGMDAAEKLRRIDKNVVLIFITNMAQFAVRGYAVDAMDFIVKPVSYYDFSIKLRKAVGRVEANADTEVVVRVENDIVRLRSSRLLYVESLDHVLLYHSLDGEFRAYGSLKSIEGTLRGSNFVRCNSCYLVNLKYVSAVHGYTAVVGKHTLQVSHPRRKEFMRALSDYLGSGSNV